jgi:hypothetical protein
VPAATAGGSWRLWTGLARRRFRARTRVGHPARGAPNFGGMKGLPTRRLARAHRVGVVRIPPSPSHLVLYRLSVPSSSDQRAGSEAATFRSCRPRCKAKVRKVSLSAVDQLGLGDKGLPLRVTHYHPAADRLHCSRSHPAPVLGKHWCIISLLKTIENITNRWGHGRVGGRSRVAVFGGRLIEGQGTKTLWINTEAGRVLGGAAAARGSSHLAVVTIVGSTPGAPPARDTGHVWRVFIRNVTCSCHTST